MLPKKLSLTDDLVLLGHDHSGALFSKCMTYRYLLWRKLFNSVPGYMLWLMLNPSKADHVQTDNTVAGCIETTKLHGCGGLMVANVFALVSTDPKRLKAVRDLHRPAQHGSDHFRSARSIPDSLCVGKACRAKGSRQIRNP